MEYFVKPKIGFIGAGSIAESHIEAAQYAGFELFGICARPNSKKAAHLSDKYKFTQTIESIKDLKKLKLDALSIITKTSEALRIYNDLLELNIPILIEKPVATSAQEFDNIVDLERKSTLVGYNRRFYSSVQELKLQISDSITQSHWKISELSWLNDPTESTKCKVLMENSIHMFDLMRYLFGEVKDVFVERIGDTNSVKGVSGIIKFATGSISTVNLSFGVPTNTSTEIYSSNNCFLLKPIEILQKYSSIKIEHPTKELPIRRYTPQVDAPWKMSKQDIDFKPGFCEQYLEFMELVLGQQRKKGASLNDAKLAVDIAEIFLNSFQFLHK
jgi:predicted dehydrogenase